VDRARTRHVGRQRRRCDLAAVEGGSRASGVCWRRRADSIREPHGTHGTHGACTALSPLWSGPLLLISRRHGVRAAGMAAEARLPLRLFVRGRPKTDGRGGLRRRAATRRDQLQPSKVAGTRPSLRRAAGTPPSRADSCRGPAAGWRVAALLLVSADGKGSVRERALGVSACVRRARTPVRASRVSNLSGCAFQTSSPTDDTSPPLPPSALARRPHRLD
jgi:hypothetical protein